MAEVKRLRTQVFNKPVGVVRADAGDDLPGRAIASAATSISNMAYREAAYRAEERGHEAALAEPSQNIVTLDPETGLPVAFGTASSYGSIAARSFENMVNRRFEESVNNELEERGREIAQQAGSAAAFRDRMSQYVSEMYSAGVNEAGEFNRYSRYIQETGTEYVASTYETLRQREVAAARAALARQQQLQGYLNLRGISHLIQSGNYMDAATAIDAEMARNDDLFNSGSQTVAQYIRRMEQIDSLQEAINTRETESRAAAAQSELFPLFAAAGDVGQARFAQMLHNPTNFPNDPNIGLVLQALSDGTSATTLLSNLNTYASSADTITESAVDSSFAMLSGQVNSNSSFPEIAAIVRSAGVTPGIREEVENNLIGHSFFLSLSDLSDSDAPSEDVINNTRLALSNPTRQNLERLAESIGEGGQEFAERVDLLYERLGPDGVAPFDAILSDYATMMSRLSSAEQRAAVDGYGTAIRGIREEANIVATRAELIRSIESNQALTNADRESLLSDVDDRFVEAALERARGTFRREDYSPATLDEVYAAIQRDQVGAPAGFDQRTYVALREAHELQDTNIQTFLSDYANGLRDRETRAAAESYGEFLEDYASAGNRLNDEQAEILQGRLFPDGVPLTALETFTDERVTTLLGQGTVLPFVAERISNAALNGNEEEVGAALAMFQIGSGTSAVIDGGVVPMDSMRNVLPTNTYTLLNNATILALTNADPMTAIFNLRDFMRDESRFSELNQTIRSAWEIEGNQSLRSAFTGMNVSIGYQDELIALARMQAASNMPLMPRDEFVQFFVERRGMSADENVVGPRIGDNVMHGRGQYASRPEIVEFTDNLQTLLVENIAPGDALERFIAGGTGVDAFIEMMDVAVLQVFGTTTNVRRFLEVVRGDGTAVVEEAIIQDRIRSGFEAVDIPIRYQPIPSTFDADDPTWLVGYEDANGMFTPFTLVIDGTEETVTFRPRVDINAPSFLSDVVERVEPVMGAETRGDLRRITGQNRILIQQAQIEGRSIPEDWRYILQSFATREHVTQQYFQDILGRDNRDDTLISLGISPQVSNEDLLNEYLEIRQMYESLPDGD